MNVICHHETQLVNATSRYIGSGNSDDSRLVKVLISVKGKGEEMVKEGESGGYKE